MTTSNNQPQAIAQRPPFLSFWPCPDVQAEPLGKNPMTGEVWKVVYTPQAGEVNPPPPGLIVPFAQAVPVTHTPFPVPTLSKILEATPENGRCQSCGCAYNPTTQTLADFPPYDLIPDKPHAEKMWRDHATGNLCGRCAISGILQQPMMVTAGECVECGNPYLPAPEPVLIGTLEIVGGINPRDVPRFLVEMHQEGKLCQGCVATAVTDDEGYTPPPPKPRRFTIPRIDMVKVVFSLMYYVGFFTLLALLAVSLLVGVFYTLFFLVVWLITFAGALVVDNLPPWD